MAPIAACFCCCAANTFSRVGLQSRNRRATRERLGGGGPTPSKSPMVAHQTSDCSLRRRLPRDLAQEHLLGKAHVGASHVDSSWLTMSANHHGWFLVLLSAICLELGAQVTRFPQAVELWLPPVARPQRPLL